MTVVQPVGGSVAQWLRAWALSRAVRVSQARSLGVIIARPSSTLVSTPQFLRL